MDSAPYPGIDALPSGAPPHILLSIRDPAPSAPHIFHFTISIPHSLSAHLSGFPIYLPIWFSFYVVFGGGIEQGGTIWPRMAEGPTSTPGQIPIRWRNPPPCKFKATGDQCQPPLYKLLGNISEMSKGGPQWPPFPTRPIFYFLVFFSVSPGPPWGLATNNQPR